MRLRASSTQAPVATGADGTTGPGLVHVVPAGAGSTWIHDEQITTVKVRVDPALWGDASAELRPAFGHRLIDRQVL